MTSLNRDPSPVDPADQGRAQAPAGAASIAATDEDRWSRRTTSVERQDSVSRRSTQIILTVIGVGVVGWLLLTL